MSFEQFQRWYQSYKDQRATAGRQPVGNREHLEAAIAWLKHAQDVTGNGGVAQTYLVRARRWAPSYPETTGYIIPTMIDYGLRYQDADSVERARRMLDWLVSIQFPEGGFMGGKVNATLRVPVTFNKWLLSDKLRGDWNYQGTLITDWDNVGRAVWEQKVKADYVHAAADAVMVGDSEENDGAARAVGCDFVLVDPLPTDQRPRALIDALLG